MGAAETVIDVDLRRPGESCDLIHGLARALLIESTEAGSRKVESRQHQQGDRNGAQDLTKPG